MPTSGKPPCATPSGSCREEWKARDTPKRVSGMDQSVERLANRWY